VIKTNGVTIPKRWEITWNDWERTLSPYAWKAEAMRAVKELGLAEERISELEALCDPTPWCNGCGASWRAGCNCGPLADKPQSI